VLFDVLADYLV